MGPRDTRRLERRLGRALRARLPRGLAEFAMFVVKQGWACLFGGLMLAALIASRALWQDDWPVARYDALFVFAVTVQALFLRFGLETWAEARVILLFHLTGTAMEWFKVAAGSWAYPDPGMLKLFDVPLFSGFMYAAVGSYIARVLRLFDMRVAPYPPFVATLALAVAIYVNFFAHHFLPDIRLALFAATVVLFAGSRIWFFIGARLFWMPLPLAAFFAACALWVAENVGTLTRTWVYAGTDGAAFASLGKLGSWYLLLYVAFVTVTLVIPGPVHRTPLTAAQVRSGRLAAGPREC